MLKFQDEWLVFEDNFRFNPNCLMIYVDLIRRTPNILSDKLKYGVSLYIGNKIIMVSFLI